MEEAQTRSLTAARAGAIPVSRVSAGWTARVVRVVGGAGVHARLTGIGITGGVRLVVIRNESRSPVLLGVKHARIAIGRALSEHVIVEIKGAFKEGGAG